MLKFPVANLEPQLNHFTLEDLKTLWNRQLEMEIKGFVEIKAVDSSFKPEELKKAEKIANYLLDQWKSALLDALKSKKVKKRDLLSNDKRLSLGLPISAFNDIVSEGKIL